MIRSGLMTVTLQVNRWPIWAIHVTELIICRRKCLSVCLGCAWEESKESISTLTHSNKKIVWGTCLAVQFVFTVCVLSDHTWKRTVHLSSVDCGPVNMHKQSHTAYNNLFQPHILNWQVPLYSLVYVCVCVCVLSMSKCFLCVRLFEVCFSEPDINQT